MKTYISLAHARKVARFRPCALALDDNPQCQNMQDFKTGVIVMREAGAIPEGAKRITPMKENLKSLGWFLLTAVSFGSIISGFLYVLGEL